MSRKEETYRLISIFSDFSNYMKEIFDIDLESAFSGAMYILSQKELPKFQNLNSEQNETIKEYYDLFHKTNFDYQTLRTAYRASFLKSLKDREKMEVEITSELPLIYLSEIGATIINNLNYLESVVLNTHPQEGSFALNLISHTKRENTKVYMVEERDSFLKLSNTLMELSNLEVPIQSNLPSLNFRCDLLISDPFLRSVEDILIYFEDYIDYLNNGGFMVTVLPTDYIRSRVFSDSLEKHRLVLIGLIEYPKDLLNGLIKSSIVIMEKKDSKNSEFFQAEMPSVKNIEDNVKQIKDIIKYMNDYMGGSENENNVN